MKKFLGIVVLGLLWCNTSFAESRLPPCQGEDHTQFVNCFGSYVGKDFSEIHNTPGLTSDYSGEFGNSPGLAHGKGTFRVYLNGEYTGLCKGEVKNDLMNGEGNCIWINGNKYVGEFKDDLSHGHGTFTSVDGDEYVGEWKDNLFHGQGTLTYANGDKYIGEWKEDYPNGQGTMTYANGDKYIGNWKDYLFHDHGTFTSVDGIVEKGIWKNGKLHKAEKIDLKKHIEKHRIKKDVKLKCMLTFVEPQKQEKSVDNEFYLSLDSKNNQIITNGFREHWRLFNITYDEINFNNDAYIIANTTIIRRGKDAHLRLMIDKFTGDMEVTSDVDYNNEGIEKSLLDKIYGEGYSLSNLGHKASCSEKIIM